MPELSHCGDYLAGVSEWQGRRGWFDGAGGGPEVFASCRGEVVLSSGSCMLVSRPLRRAKYRHL